MTKIDTSALGELKTGKASKKAAWEPLLLADLQEGRYLACDQSLTATGLVLFCVDPEGPRIVDAAKLTSDETGLNGWEDAGFEAATASLQPMEQSPSVRRNGGSD